VGRRAPQRVHRADLGPLIRALLSGFWRRATRPSPFRLALLATLALCLGYVPASRAPAVQQIEAQLLDLRFRLRPPAPRSDDIVLMLIDEQSIREIGRWPWSRTVIADALARLAAAGARTIGIDLLFFEAEPSAIPEVWRDRLRQALGDLAAFLDSVSGDAELAGQMRAAGNVVLPYVFRFDAPPATDDLSPPVLATAFRIVHGPGTARSMPPLSPTSVLAPIRELAEAASTLGHTNGTARYEFPAVSYGDNIYPSFALEIARQHLSVPQHDVRLELGRGVWLGDRLLPTDDRTQFMVNYRGTDRFQSVSIAQLLAGSVPAADFEGKVVLIGASAPGLGETFVTPFDAYLPAIEWRATVIDNILQQDFMVRRADTVLLDLGFVIGGGLLIGWLAGRPGLLGPSLGFGAFAAAVLAANVVAFFEFGRWLDLFAPLLALLVLYAIVVLYKYFIGERQERRIRAAFKHYLSPALVEQVAREPELLRLGGEQKELTVLFADIRNSTAIGAKLPPEVFIGLLNDVLDSMTHVLFAHDGMLDKYTGDGLVAVFGAPLPQPDHALRACRAALAMLDQLAPVRAGWARPDLPQVEIGIGINTGPMIIGNMGSKERFAYTVIGDEANLGSRLEAANKDFQTHILISEATWQAVKGEIAARELDVVTFRGMARPVRVYEVLGTYPLAADAARRLAAFESGLAAWREKRWPEAKRWFEQVLALAPEDRPSQIYLERCRDRLAGRPEASAAS
jgi:adenylate cyclase